MNRTLLVTLLVTLLAPNLVHGGSGGDQSACFVEPNTSFEFQGATCTASGACDMEQGHRCQQMVCDGVTQDCCHDPRTDVMGCVTLAGAPVEWPEATPIPAPAPSPEPVEWWSWLLDTFWYRTTIS